MSKRVKPEEALSVPTGTDTKRIKTKRERFIELAPMRTNKTIKALQNLARCASKTGYEYTAGEADQILAAVYGAWKATESAFRQQKQTQQGFSLQAESIPNGQATTT